MFDDCHISIPAVYCAGCQRVSDRMNTSRPANAAKPRCSVYKLWQKYKCVHLTPFYPTALTSTIHAFDRQTDGRTEFSSLDRVCSPCSAVEIECKPIKIGLFCLDRGTKSPSNIIYKRGGLDATVYFAAGILLHERTGLK